VQLTPLSTHWAPRKKNKKRVQSFSDTVYITSKFYFLRRVLYSHVRYIWQCCIN